MSSRSSPATNGVDPDASRQSELARVLDDYLAAVEAGEVVDPGALPAAHPEIAERLRACLSVLRVASRVEARADADAAIEPAVDTRLGDFHIVRMIGRGAMGIVFEAEQVSLRRRVALKVMPFAAALDPHQLRRFQIEAQAAAQLHHTNIVPIFSVGCERGVHYYAMQFIEGQTLADLIRDLRRLSGFGEASAAEPTVAGVSLAEEIVSGRLDPSPAPLVGRGSPDPARPSAEGLRSRGPAISASPDSTRTPAYFRTVADLGLQAAEALAHAHGLGTIHRDIKPANLLVDVRGNLWDAATGQVLRILRGHVDDVNYVSFSPDGRLLATGGDDGTVRLWDAVSGNALATLGKHSDWVTCVLFTPDGRRVISGAKDKQVKIWDIDTRREQAPLAPGLEIEGMALSPDGRTLSTSGWGPSVKLWNLASRRMTLSLEVKTRTQSVAFSHDGRFVATGGNDRIVRVWDTEKGRLEATLRGHTNQVECVAFSPDDRILASSAHDGTVRLWDIASERLRKVYQGHGAPRSSDNRVWCVAFSPDGRTLASCGRDSKVNLWDLSSAQDRIPISIPGQSIRSVVLSPGRSWVTTFVLDGQDGIVAEMDRDRGELLSTRRIHAPSPLFDGVLSSNGRRLASASVDGTVTLYDTESGLPEKSHSVPGIRFVHPESRVTSLGKMTFSPGGRFLAITKPREGVLIWDTESDLKRHSPRFDNAIVEFLPGDEGVLVHHARGLARGDLATGDYQPLDWTGHEGLACMSLSADGRKMATGAGDGTIKLWDARRLELEATLLAHGEEVTSLAWSPDGTVLASHSQREGTIRLWDMATRQELGAMVESAYQYAHLTFSSDGSILATIAAEPFPQVVLWPAPRDEKPSR